MKKTALLLAILIFAVCIMSSCQVLSKFFGNDEELPCEHKDEVADHVCDLCSETLSECNDADDDHKCDVCGTELTKCLIATDSHNCGICGTILSQCSDGDKDHKCDVCGKALTECADANNDHKCDSCGATLSQCADANNNHKCDVCDTALSQCADADNNHKCDVCDTALSQCADADNNHKCDVCDTALSQCADADNNHKCDLCNATISQCADADDHKCDVCGDTLSQCADGEDEDHNCDICGKCIHEYEENVWYHPELVEATCCTPGVAVFECIYCDHYYTEATPINPEAHGFWGDEEIVTEANCVTQTNGLKKVACANGCGAIEEVEMFYSEYHNWDVQKEVYATCTEDGEYYAVCTLCGEVEEYTYYAEGHYNWYLSCGQIGECLECGEEFTVEHDLTWYPATCTEAAVCWNCEATVGEPLGHNYVDGMCSVCEEEHTDCADEDNNHKCDVCDKVISECTDEDDHFCDICDQICSECADENDDHNCDICDATISTCIDEDKDHICDICRKTISECSDNDDHKCDVCGETISECADKNKDHNCDVCDKPLSECADDNKDHNCDYCGTLMSQHVDENEDHVCEFCGGKASNCIDTDMDYICDLALCDKAFEDAEYELNVSDVETGTRAEDDINGKFTIVSGTEVRTRSRTYDGVEYTKSVKLGSSSSKIKVNVSGTGKLSFLIQNGSSGADVQYVVITAPDGTKKEIEFAGNNSGSPVVKIEVDVTDGEWTITRKSGTIDIYYLHLDCHMPESPECGFELVTPGKTDYICNTELDLSGLRLNAVFESGKTDPLDTALVTIDTSKVDMTKAGTYEITVSYKDYTPVTYEVKVYVPTELKLDFDATVKEGSSSAGNGLYFNNSFKEVYTIGEELSFKGLTVTVVASNGEETVEFTINNYVVKGFDSETAGAKLLTVEYEYESGKIVTGTVTVHVVDATPTPNGEGVYMLLVNPGYTGVVGVLDNSSHVFTTIQQALDFAAKIDAGAKKVIEIAPGTYKEKLEITVPNLTIRGIGDSSEDVVIEWNSLYGIPDASGYVQVTDSTATVAVRDTAINCVIENITISNYWNSLEVFDNDLGEGYAEHRALALLVQADRFILRDSRLLGYQDTVEFFTGRQYVENCYIAGTTDFIFGTNNTTLFVGCEIHSIDNGKKDGGYVTAFKGMNKNADDAIKYGAIFYQCKFTAPESVVANGNDAIGRTWGAYAAVAVINCEIGGHISVKPSTGASKNERYVSMNGIRPDQDATVQFVEFGNTGAGALTEAVAGMKMLTAEEAAKYFNFDVIFGKTNGKLTYLEAWNPNSTETETDDKTYYYFDQTLGSTGTTNTFDTNTTITTGSTLEWADLLISAEAGNVAWNSNANALNMKAGAFIKFSVKAGTEVIVSAYPGYEKYTINGVGTTASIFSQYYAEDTEVVILSVGDFYLFSIIINPDEEAPEAPTLEEIKVEGVNVNYTLGTEFSLEGAVVKAYYSDNSYCVVEYQCNTEAINKDAEGSYEVVFTYGGKSVTVTVNYENPNAAEEITKDTLLDFSTPDGLAAVQNNKRVTIEGSVRHNGGEIQIKGTISFPVKAGTVITVIPYGNSAYASYTIGKVGEENLTIYNVSTEYVAEEDCVIVYTGLENNYLVAIDIKCPIAEGTYVFGGASVEGDVTGILESISGLSISGTCKTHSGGAQIGEDTLIAFTLPAYGSVTIKGYDTNYGKLLVYAGDELIEMNAEACYVFSVTKTTHVKIYAMNVGTEEAPAYNQSYITYIKVQLPDFIDENTNVTFGTEGNYKESGIDFSGLQVGDNGGNNSQVKNGSFSFYVKAGAIVTVHGYNGYTSYTLSDGTTTTEEIKDEYYTYTAAADVKITITPVDGNNYFYSLSIEYPIDEDTTVTFGTEGNYKESGIDFSGLQVGDNGGNNSQVKNGSFYFYVKSGAVVTVHGYNGYTSYTLSDGTNTTEEIKDEYYTYTATADVKITITPVDGNNYFYSISITYPVVEEPEMVEVTYTFDATNDLAAMEAGKKANGEVEILGTDGFFTIHYSAKTKVDGSKKTFDDGYSATQRLNTAAKTVFDENGIQNAIEFTTNGAATVTIWWVCGGDGREVDLYNAEGAEAQTTAEGCVKNSLYISTFEISEAGTYYIGCSEGSNYYFKVEVTVTEVK